jgi:hypothetical protein
LWCAIFDWPKQTLGCHRNMTYFRVGLLWGPHCLHGNLYRTTSKWMTH